MPVVPITKAGSRGKGFSPRGSIDVPAADEPWMLMAAAQMDADGRLVEAEASSPLGKALGTDDLDKAPR